MKAASCQAPLAWDALLAYWLGELDPETEMHIEEHYLGCGSCTRRLEWLASLQPGVRSLIQGSGVNMVIDDRFVDRLRAGGLRVREYRVPLNGSVNCTVAPQDDIVVAWLEAPLEGLKRVDMITLGAAGEIRQEDIPFVAESGGVVFSPRIQDLRALPATILRVHLLAVDSDGERTLGEYAFNHTPWESRRPD